MKEKLLSLLKDFDIKIEDDILNKLEIYFEFLKEKNSVINLTAIRDDEGIIEKHFLDSIIMMKYIGDKFENAVDIGTGAGFPGMVLAIINPDKKFTLIDSVGKKIKFLEELRDKLRITNVELSSMRSEEFIISEKRREYYDVVLCRGVAELRVILEYCIPFLKKGGKFFPQKMNFEDEVKDADNALKILKSKLLNIHEFGLPLSNDKRVVLEILKDGITDNKYPRKTGMPKKKPL